VAEWKRICCAVDLSEPSRFAMEEAAELASRLQADLTLLYVHEADPASAQAPVSLPDLVKQTDTAKERLLSFWRGDAEVIAGRTVHSASLTGRPDEEILRFVRDGCFDLLVVGTHGRSGLKRLVLGSVAERVLRHAECPVLVIRGSTSEVDES
jgi:nucleotide-binding universal stress UspA family protein